jgi:hypothetical protein
MEDQKMEKINPEIPKTEDGSKISDPSEIDTTNKFLVSGTGRGIVIMNPPRKEISHEDALLLAAYLVSMSDPYSGMKFEDVLNAVQST